MRRILGWAARFEQTSTLAQNRGTILHALTLGTAAPFRVLDVADYKGKAAQTLRDETIAAGLIPVKAADMEELQDVASAVRQRLRDLPDVWAAMQDAVQSGMTEATLIWRERDVLSRVRYDTLPAAKFGATYDLKFTGKSADPADVRPDAGPRSHLPSGPLPKGRQGAAGRYAGLRVRVLRDGGAVRREPARDGSRPCGPRGTQDRSSAGYMASVPEIGPVAGVSGAGSPPRSARLGGVG